MTQEKYSAEIILSVVIIITSYIMALVMAWVGYMPMMLLSLLVEYLGLVSFISYIRKRKQEK